MKLWLDDIRPAPEGWIWIKHPKDVIQYFLEGTVEEISFDHDLGAFIDDKEITGYQVLCALETFFAFGTLPKSSIPSKFHVHSANSGARKKMELCIQSIERMR